jgi:signal transduction histidine kinase/DNA-binding NarL/FixJ family response regulator
MAGDRVVLIIDDCAEDREVYQRFLCKDSRETYAFLEADCAETALVVLKQQSCDLILLDFCLPGLNGLEFLEDLQQQQPNLSVPVIMLTGQGAETVAVDAMKWGVQDYLIKNQLKADILQLSVRNVLQQTALKAQLSRIRERQRLIATTALRIRQSLNLEEILNTAVAEVQQILRCEQVAIYEFPAGMAAELPALLAAGTVRAQALCDEMGMLPPHHSPADLIESISLVRTAAVASELHFWGAIVAYQQTRPRSWSPDEREILHEVAVQLAIAIQQAQLLAQTQASLEKAKELSQFKSQIITTVSHEYCTPLAAIWAAASTIKRHGDRLSPVQIDRYLGIIEQKSQRLKQLVEDMLSVQRCEMQQMFSPVSLDLVPLVTEIIAEQQDIAGTNHKLLLTTKGSCKGFRGDPNLLRLIFSNLISNAVKYSPSGSGIAIKLISTRSTVAFSVEDPGIGVPPGEQANLFEEFQRGSNVGHVAGLGLGLAIARSCTEMHGGTIQLLTPKAKRGTTILVELPKKP